MAEIKKNKNSEIVTYSQNHSQTIVNGRWVKEFLARTKPVSSEQKSKQIPEE